ncbi:uncharacterized protein akap12a [Gadus morhua]|uniref:A kinase-anchoring proteins AKAP-5 and AKAP-12 calmodulin (CaM)-binding domain-containing protein n=1 Tax=Gadus morhua TaxID=8049 RepID=A0A8C5C813_GADMO|nr:uncharacterized protein LOC115544025 [Gadus morhua]
MGDTQSAPRDAEQDAERDTDSGRAQDSGDCNVEDKLPENDTQISGLHGKSDGPLAELNDHLEDEFNDDLCDTESPLVSAREDVSDTFATVDDKEALLEDVEINNVTDSDPEADEASLNDQEDKMNEINKGFRRFFSNISLKLTLKQGPDDKPAEIASDVLPNQEVAPCIPGDTCEGANESTSETCENNGDPHTAQDSADNESTTCPTVTDMTSEENIQEDVEHKTPAATEVDQEATEGILAQADTEGVRSEVEPGGSCPQDSAEEEVLSPIKVFFTTGIFSSLRKKKKPAEEESLKIKTNQKESVDMDREEQGGIEGIGKDLAQHELFPKAEIAVVEEKQKTKNGNEEVMRESAPTNNDHGTGENLVNANDELLSSEEKVKFPSSSLQRLLSGANLKKVSTKQQGRKKSSDSVERVTCPLQSSVESSESTTDESPKVAPEEVKKLEESAWETLKRLLTPKKFQKNSTLSNEEVIVSSKPEEPKLSEGEEIEDGNTEESRKRKDSIVSWDSLLCGSGNRRSRKSSSADEQKARTEGDDNRAAAESRHATDLDSSHEMEDNLASSPEHGRSPSDDEGSTWKSLKRLVTPKRKSRDGEETKEHTSDSEIIQDESSFSLKKFLPGRRKRRPYEKQEEVPSDKPEREEHSDEEDSDTPAIIPLSEFDIPVTESQGKIQAMLESQTAEAEAPKEQEELTGQTTDAVVMCDSTPALPKGTKDTENALEKLTSTTPASMEEVEDLSEIVSKLQLLSDIPEEGLIEESIATPASFADDAARDDTIADVIEFASEAVTAPEPIDITVEDETEMVSAVSQLTDSSKTSGNTTPVPADYDVKETDNLLRQVVESISATQNDAVESTSDQYPERIAGSVPSHKLESSFSKELTILTTHQTSNATLLCTGFTVEAFDAIDRVAEAECFSDMTETIYTQCLSEDTTEEFHTAGMSVDEELKNINESQLVTYSSSEGNKAKTSAILPPAENVNVSETSIDDHKNDNEQDHEMAPPGNDSYVEATIQVQSEEMVDESETLTLTDACVSNSEATPTDEIAKGSHILSGEQIQDVAELSVGYGEQHGLLVVEVGVAEFGHVPVSAPIEPEEVIMKADKTNSQLHSFPSVDVGQAEQGVQELQSQSMTEDIPEQDSTVPDSSPSTEAKEQIEHTLLETEMYIKEDVAEILQDALCEDGDETTEVTGELHTERSVEESEESNVQVLEHKVITEDSPVLEDLTQKRLATREREPKEVPQHTSVEEDELEVMSNPMTSVIHNDTNNQVVEKQVITEDNAEFQAENALPSSTSEVEKKAAAVSEQGLAEREHIYRANDPCEEPREVLGHEDGQPTEVPDQLETLTSQFVASIISDVSVVQLLEKQLISEDIAESQAEEAKTKVEMEATIVTEQGFVEKELVSREKDPCDATRQVLIQEDGILTEVTDELKTSESVHLGTLNSEARNVAIHQQLITSEHIIGSLTENACTSITDADEKENATQSKQSLLSKGHLTVESVVSEELLAISITDYVQVADVTKELKPITSTHEASVDSNTAIVEVLEKQVSEDIPEQDRASASVTDKVENETGIERILLEKPPTMAYDDPDEIPQQSVAKEEAEVVKGSTEVEAPPAVQIAPLNPLFSIVEGIEKQVTSQNLLSNAENADPVITFEDEKATVTQPEQSLLEKEFSTVESDLSEEPQQSSVTEDFQVAEFTKELQATTFVYLASVDSNAGIVEVHEKQGVSEDLEFNAVNASTLIQVEDEKETVTQSAKSLLLKEHVIVESDVSEEPQHISVTDDTQVAEVTKELDPPAHIHLASVDSNAGIVEVLGNKDLSGDILVPEGPLVSMTAEVEKETGVLTEEAHVVEQLPTMDYDPNEIPQQSVVKEDDEVVKVLIESDAPPTLHTAPLISESSVVLIIVEQVTFDDLGSNAENAQPVSTVEEDKETVTQPERCLLEKELVTVESDFIEEAQHISVTDVVQIADITKELEASTSIDVVSVDYNAGIVEVLEQRGVSKNLESNAENASTLIQVEDEKETVTQSAQSLLEKELVIVESDRSEEPQHISVKDDVQVSEVTKELDPQTHINLASAGIVEVLENQVQSGEIPVHEGSSVSLTAEVENETGVLTEEAQMVEQLPTMDYDPNEIPQQSVVKENNEEVQVSTEFEVPTTLHPAPLISESSIVEIFEEQVTFEDLGSNAEDAQPISSVEEDKETVTQPERCLLEKELVVVESDLIVEPQHISFTDVLQIADITKELEASTSIDVVFVVYNAGIVEVLEQRGVSKNLESNAVNASTLIQVEDEKETVTQSAQSLLEKELVIVESDRSEEPQHISVKNDVQVAEVTKELDPQTHINLASAGIVEVLENQVKSGEIPVHEGSSLSETAEVKNETGVLTEEALVVEQLPTMDYDPNEIPQQSVVKENDEVVQVSTEFEAPPTLHPAPLISEASIVQIFEEQVTFEDLGSNAENAQPVSSVEEDKETVTQPEQCLLEKELVVVESDLIVEPQHISFTDVLQIADITKEFEASTTIDEDSVDFNAGIVEVLEKQDISEDILVHDVASVTAEIENETEILQQALVVKTVSNLDYDPNEIPQQNVLKDGEVVKLSEFEAPSHVQITPLTSDSSIVEVIEKQVTEELGSDAEKANTLITVENAKVIYSEQSLLVKEPVSIESNLNEEPQHISVTDVQVTEVTKELEASTFDQVALLDSNADIVEILGGVVGGNALPTGNDDPHEIPQQRVVEQDCKVVQTEFEAPPTVQIAPLVLGSSMVEVIGKQVLSDIPVTNGENASASTTAEAGEEVLIAQELIKKVLRTVVGDPDEIPRQCAVKNEHEFADIAKLLDGSTEVDIDSINSDTSVPQALQEHVLSEVIPTPDTDNASVNSVTEVAEMLEAPTAVKLVLINRETILPEVFEKQQVHDYVTLVVTEPSHEVVSNAVNDEGDIDKLAGAEENAEMVEDVAAMQDEDGAAMQACGVETSMDHDANRETPNIREPLLDVMATEEEPQDTVEHVRVLEPCVEEGMIEMTKKSKGDVEVKSAEEMGVTDAKEGMDIGCIVQNEVQNVYTSLATEEEMLDKMDNVTAKEVDQQKNQTEVSDEVAKEESCLKEEPGSAVQVIVTPPTDERKGTEIIKSEPTELEAQKLTKKESDASIERTAPEVLSETEIGNELETASNIVFATTDDVAIYKLKPDLDETEVELKKESDKNVIEEDSSCSPELLAAIETIEAKQAIVVPQIITSSEKVQPTSEMGVEEIQATENVESNIQMEVTELEKEKEDPTIKIEVTELQGLEKTEPNIQKEVKELGTEQKRQIQVSEVNVNVAPKIQMEGTEFPATEKLESTLQMEGTELQVTEEAEQNIKIALTNIKVTVKVVVQAIEAIDLEKTKVDAHLIDDSSFSPQEVAVKEIMDAKQEQTHPCEMVTPSQEGEPTIKNEEATEIQLTEKVEPKIQMEATEHQGKKKVEPNIQIAFTEMKDPLTQRERPEVGVQAEEAIEKARTIQMAEVPERLQEACVSEVSVTRVLEVTGLVQELDSTREMIQVVPVALQVGLEQVVFLSQTGPAHFAEEPLETKQQRLVHVEQAERTVPSSPPVQPEVVVESAESVSQWEGELEQDVWLDAEEDIGKQEGAEKTGNEPQESVQSQLEVSQAEDQEEVFLDTTGHAHIEEESSPEEIQAIGEIHELEREGEDFAIALEDPQIKNLTETSLICKELD